MSASDLVFSHLPMSTAVCDAALTTAIAVEAATGDKYTWTAMSPMTVTRVGVQIVVAIDYDTLTTAAVVAFDKRVTYGSDTGRVEMGRVTIPNGTPAGKVIFVDIPTGDSASNEDGDLLAGQQVVCEVVVQGAGGTELGDWQAYLAWEPASELPANNVDGTGALMMLRDITTAQV